MPTSTNKKSPPNTSFKIIQTPRRRSPRACLPCRIRKVRCTVSMQGIPCVNCELDGKECVVVKRSSKRSNQNQCNAEHQEAAAACTQDHDSDTHPHVEAFEQASAKPAWDSQQPVKPRLDAIGRFLGEEVHLKDFLDTSIEPRPTTHQPLASNFRIPHVHQEGDSPSSSTPTIDSSTSSLSFSNFVDYSAYPFISISNLSSISPQHCEFLRSQGCFQLPQRQLMDEFIKQYFMHVHPTVPFLDERSFWAMYEGDDLQADRPRQYIHLLVMWTIVFAACGHITPATAATLGFETIRAARAVFYQRAKLLFDLGPDSSAIERAQAAVLLSFWSGASRPGPIGPNSMWLKVAIHYAQMVRAHQACQMSNHLDPSPTDKNQSLLRRLWWSCIVRDRSLALGLKRSVQIVREYPVPTLADFDDEIDASRVYDAVTNQYLVQQMLQFMELCKAVNDLLLICSPPEGSEGQPVGTTEEIIEKLSSCRLKLQSWREHMTYEYADQFSDEGLRHHSVMVFTSTMYIYYHAAKLTLHHCEILLSTFKPDKVYTITTKGHSPSKQSQEVQEDAMGIITCLSDLRKQGLVQYVSSSVVAFAALPLLLNVLDLKLSSPNDPSEEMAKKRHRLQILLEAMNEHQPRYDGVEDISQAVRLIANFAHSDSFSAATFHAARDWTDILALQPNCYLRLALTMDLCLKMEVVPTENDIWCLLKSRLGNESGLNYIIPLANVASNQPSEAQETSSFAKQSRAKKLTPRANTLDDEPTQFDAEMERTLSGVDDAPRLLDEEMPVTPKPLHSAGLSMSAGDLELSHLLASEYETLGSIYGLDASPSLALNSNSVFDYLNLDRDRDVNMDSRPGSFMDSVGLGEQAIGI